MKLSQIRAAYRSGYTFMARSQRGGVPDAWLRRAAWEEVRHCLAHSVTWDVAYGATPDVSEAQLWRRLDDRMHKLHERGMAASRNALTS